METAVILAIVIVVISVVVTALGFTVGGVSRDSIVTWIQSTFFGGTLGYVFSGIQSIVAVVLAVSAKAITKTVTVIVSGVRNILNKNKCSNDSDSSKEPTGPNEVEMKSKTSKTIDSGNCETLLNDIKNFSDTSSSAGEKESARKMLEILKLLEEINESLEKEEK